MGTQKWPLSEKQLKSKIVNMKGGAKGTKGLVFIHIIK